MSLLFTIERPQPGYSREINYHRHEGDRSATHDLVQSLPIEVEAVAEPRGKYASACKCRVVFRLTDDAVKRLKKFGLYREGIWKDANACVCCCMGRVG